MVTMFGNLTQGTIPNATIPAPALLTIDADSLLAVAGAVLVGLIAASVVRLVRGARRPVDIRIAAASRLRGAA